MIFGDVTYSPQMVLFFGRVPQIGQVFIGKFAVIV